MAREYGLDGRTIRRREAHEDRLHAGDDHCRLDGQLDNVQNKKHPVFNLDMPTTCPGVAESVLDPRSTWPDAAQYDEQAKKLAKMFVDNFVTFENNVAASIKAAGPKA